MTNFLQTQPFLQRQWNFPDEIDPALATQSDLAYVSIAQKTNERIIGVFAENFQIIDGEFWYLNGTRYQGLRQVYQFTGPGPVITIPHGINTSQIFAFTKIYGTFTDGTKWYPLPYVDVVNVDNQVNIVVDGTNIIITAGAGSPPTITKGLVVLEWIAGVNNGE